MSKTTRKDKLERTVRRYRSVCAHPAWQELMLQIECLTDADVPVPKFRDLLVAIRRAGAKGFARKRRYTPNGFPAAFGDEDQR